jgi:hypothetical protein
MTIFNICLRATTLSAISLFVVLLLGGCSSGPSEAECAEAKAIAAEYITNVTSLIGEEGVDIEKVADQQYDLAALTVKGWPDCFDAKDRRWANRQLRGRS